MADTFGAIAEAFVRLRAKADPNFEKDTRDSVLPSLQRLATDIAGLAIGKKIINIGQQGIEELKQAEQVTAQTEIQLKATGNAAGVTAEHIDKLGQQMLDLAGFDDEAARSAANVLLRFKEIQGNNSFDRVMKDAADLAVTLGTDLPSAARTLGLALEDPEKAVRLLRSANVVLDQAQKDAIKSAIEQGDQAQIQSIILGALEKQIGGAAKAYGDTLAGSQAKATEAMKNAKAELVQGFAPALQLGADITAKFAQGISALPPQLQAVGGGIVFLGSEIIALAPTVASVVQVLDKLRVAREASAAAAAVEAAATEAEAAAQVALNINSAAAVAGLYAEAEAATTTAAALGPIGLIATAAAAALSVGLLVALKGNTESSVDAKTATDAYTQALKDNSEASLDNATATQLAGQNSSKGAQALAQSFRDAGIPMSVFFDEIRHGTTDLVGLQHNAELGGAGLSFLDENLRKSADGGSEFARSLLEAHQAGRLNDEQVVAAIKSANTLSGALGDARAQQDIWKAVTETSATAMGTFNTTQGDAILPLKLTSEELKVQEQALKDNTAAAQDLQATYQSIIDKTLGAFSAGLSEVDAQIASRKALQDLADLPGVQADKLAALSRSVSDAEKSIADAQQRLEDARAKAAGAKTDSERASALASERSATDALATANRQLADAQKKQADQSLTSGQAQDELTKKTNDALRAILAEAEAHRKNYEATVTATGATVDAATSNQRLVEELVKVRDTLAPDSPLRAALDQYIVQLQNVPANVVSNLELRYKETGDVSILRELISIALSGDTGKIIDQVGMPYQARAGGGYASAGWVLRGEKGPEWTYENMPSYTLPADASAQISGGDTHFHSNVTMIGSQPELVGQVARELQRTAFLQTGRTQLARR